MIMKLMSLLSYHVKGVEICVYIIQRGISGIMVQARREQLTLEKLGG